MRTLRILLAIGAVGLAAPAGAAIVPYTLTGTLEGFQTTIMCDASLGGCPTFSAFTQDFGLIVDLELGPGTNSFSVGSPFASGLWQGTIINDGTLIGLNLTFGQTNCPAGPPIVGCYGRSGSAPSFNVQAGAVPEPSTWLFMLLGFGMVGRTMRRAKRRLLSTQTCRDSLRP